MMYRLYMFLEMTTTVGSITAIGTAFVQIFNAMDCVDVGFQILLSFRPKPTNTTYFRFLVLLMNQSYMLSKIFSCRKYLSTLITNLVFNLIMYGLIMFRVNVVSFHPSFIFIFDVLM